MNENENLDDVVIVSVANSRYTETQVNSGQVNKPVGVLFFKTQDLANNYSKLNKWGNGTFCYTKTLDIGVLVDGAWEWN